MPCFIIRRKRLLKAGRHRFWSYLHRSRTPRQPGTWSTSKGDAIVIFQDEKLATFLLKAIGIGSYEYGMPKSPAAASNAAICTRCECGHPMIESDIAGQWEHILEDGDRHWYCDQWTCTRAMPKAQPIKQGD